MARTKAVESQAKAVENQVKSWDEKSNEEKLASIKDFNKMVIASAIKEAHTRGEEPFFRKR